jgi:hypothetical protein
MGRVWVLDTETKGTGAEMVPLDKVLKKPAPASEPLFVPPERKPREPKPPEPRPPLSFRIVDVMSRAVLADHASTREALGVLDGVRSVVDVTVSVWQPKAQRWRRLTLDEQRAMWERRKDVQPPPSTGA